MSILKNLFHEYFRAPDHDFFIYQKMMLLSVSFLGVPDNRNAKIGMKFRNYKGIEFLGIIDSKQYSKLNIKPIIGKYYHVSGFFQTWNNSLVTFLISDLNSCL